MRKVRTALLLILAGTVGSALSPSVTLAQKKSRDVITKEEIMAPAQKDRDLLQIIRSLRPHFFAGPRGVRSMGNAMIYPVQLYVNDVHRSGIDELKNIKPDEVEEIRYLDSSRAQETYGINHNGGAIMVTLRRQ